jgi:acyl carrier protein
LKQEIETAVREFVLRNFLFDENVNLSSETSFLGNGIIDSTGVLELISFIEEKYGIKFENHEVVPENLDSIQNIASFVKGKLDTAQNVRCALAN